MRNGYYVTLRPSPFSLANRTHVMEPGQTLAEMVACYPGLPPEFDEFGMIAIGGHVIPRENWRKVRVIPERGNVPTAVSLYLLPMGGGGGGGGAKQTLQLVGTIAIIAAAAAVSAGALGPAGLGIAGGFFAAGSTSAAVLSAGISIAGTMALHALAPPPVSAAARRAELGTTAGPGGMTGIQANPLQPLQTIPTVLGMMKVSPPHLISPYTELIDGKVTVFACVGLAGAIDITDVRVNGMDAASFATVTTHSSETGAAMTLAIENVREELPGETLSRHVLDETTAGGVTLLNGTDADLPQYHYYRTQGVPNFVRLRLLFPAGLFRYSSTQVVGRALVPIRIEMRRVGDVSWINLPELWISDPNFKAGRPLRHQITLSWGTNDTNILAPDNNTMLEMAYAIAATGQAHQYSAHTDFLHSGVSAKRITRTGYYVTTIHLATATFPQTAEYEIRVKRGAGFQPGGALTTTYPTAGGGAADSNWFGRSAGVIGVTEDQFLKPFDAVVESLATIRDGLPLDPAGLSYVEVQAEGLQIDSISFTAQSKSNNWTGAAWQTAGTTATSNPASLFRHLLLNSTGSDLNAEPLSQTLLEEGASESLVTWYTYCNTNSLECNMIVDGRPLEEVLQIVCACGHAALRRSDKWGVIIEKDRSGDSIVQLFSPRNTWSSSIRKVFPDPPLDGLFVTYVNSAEDYSTDEHEETYTAGANVEAIDYPGITTNAQVVKRARLDLRQRALRSSFYNFQTDMQGIVSQRGDLVGYLHDVVDQARVGARINKVLFNSGGNATGLILDTAVKPFMIASDVFAAANVYSLADVFAAQSVGIVIMKLDGTFVTRTIDQTGLTESSDESQQVNFTAVISGLAGSDTDYIGAEVAIGILSSEYRRCIITEIQWDGELNASVTLVDEAPTIHPL